VTSRDMADHIQKLNYGIPQYLTWHWHPKVAY